MAGAERAVGLAIMAKAPRVGAVKTRLCPPLRAPEAAELARCFLLDAVDRVRVVAGARPIMAYAPVEAQGQFEEAAPGFALIAQRGGDLGERQLGLIEDVLGLGLQAALVIGTDSPTLPRECLDEAVSLVMARDVDVVLGPTEDGGYYLIGHARALSRLCSSTCPGARLRSSAARSSAPSAWASGWPACPRGSTWTPAPISSGCASSWRRRPAASPRHTRAFLERRISRGLRRQTRQS